MVGWINSKSRDEFRSLPQTRTMSFSPRNDFSSCKVLLYDEACCWLFSFKQGFLILLISGPNAPSSTISIMDFLYIQKIFFQPYFFYFVTLFLLQFIDKQHHIFNTLFIFFQKNVLLLELPGYDLSLRLCWITSFFDCHLYFHIIFSYVILYLSLHHVVSNLQITSGSWNHLRTYLLFFILHPLEQSSA